MCITPLHGGYSAARGCRGQIFMDDNGRPHIAALIGKYLRHSLYDVTSEVSRLQSHRALVYCSRTNYCMPTISSRTLKALKLAKIMGNITTIGDQ
ncbi:hypothetical protein TNCV_3394891 [Trichonephila clavipes]|nr:hypothetical protein TNCV_3394891 [Trichonephila clavipes]